MRNDHQIFLIIGRHSTQRPSFQGPAGHHCAAAPLRLPFPPSLPPAGRPTVPGEPSWVGVLVAPKWSFTVHWLATSMTEDSAAWKDDWNCSGYSEFHVIPCRSWAAASYDVDVCVCVRACVRKTQTRYKPRLFTLHTMSPRSLCLQVVHYTQKLHSELIRPFEP